jgi:hypothetical protein
VGYEKFSFVQLNFGSGFVYVKPIVHFAFSGDDGSFPSEQLFKNRYAECAPQQVALTTRERRMIKGTQDHNRSRQTREIESASAFPVGQGQGEIDGRNERVRSIGTEPLQIASAKLPHIGFSTKMPFEQSDSDRAWQRETKHVRGADTRTESTPKE